MIINLTKNFEPFGLGDSAIMFTTFDFPSGCEPHIKFDKNSVIFDEPILITTRMESMNDFMRLLLATDALKRSLVHSISALQTISVFISYLPFARQDKVMEEGEPLSLRVIADLINAQGYKKVLLYDVHSPTALAVIDRSVSINNHRFVANILRDKEDYLIVSPDNGASKKIYPLCKALNYKGAIVQGDKVRDIATGEVIDVTISHTDLKGKDVYMIDDICDGGKTFIVLAEKLKEANAGKINLIVSHGIFSKRLTPLLKNISTIYCTNSFSDYEDKQTLEVHSHKSDRFKQIKLNAALLQ